MIVALLFAQALERARLAWHAVRLGVGMLAAGDWRAAMMLAIGWMALSLSCLALLMVQRMSLRLAMAAARARG
jgi:hypothetical protein